MKKTILTFVSLFLLAIVYFSCKSHGTCPAYGKVQKNTTEKAA